MGNLFHRSPNGLRFCLNVNLYKIFHFPCSRKHIDFFVVMTPIRELCCVCIILYSFKKRLPFQKLLYGVLYIFFLIWNRIPYTNGCEPTSPKMDEIIPFLQDFPFHFKYSILKYSIIKLAQMQKLSNVNSFQQVKQLLTKIHPHVITKLL